MGGHLIFKDYLMYQQILNNLFIKVRKNKPSYAKTILNFKNLILLEGKNCLQVSYLMDLND
jgi:hypothetical protein